MGFQDGLLFGCVHVCRYARWWWYKYMHPSVVILLLSEGLLRDRLTLGRNKQKKKKAEANADTRRSSCAKNISKPTRDNLAEYRWNHKISVDIDRPTTTCAEWCRFFWVCLLSVPSGETAPPAKQKGEGGIPSHHTYDRPLAMKHRPQSSRLPLPLLYNRLRALRVGGRASMLKKARVATPRPSRRISVKLQPLL